MKVAVLACHDPALPRVPPDLAEVIYVDDLCRGPTGLTGIIGDADRLVMIVHPSDVALARLQQASRRAGVDPLGIRFVSAEAVADDGNRAKVALAGARAGAAVYAGSRPQQARPSLSGPRSRREMLAPHRPSYDPLPMIDHEICAATSGCRACVIECPQDAYEWRDGTIRFSRDRCVTCGRCVTTCPAGAIATPAFAGPALASPIEAMVAAASPRQLGIAFVCRRRSRSIRAPGWAEIDVPCTGMAPATWPIAALLLGAATAALIPCADTGCPLGNDQRVMDTVAAARDLLEAAGLQPDYVQREAGPLADPLDRRDLSDPFGVHGPAEVALALRGMTERHVTVATVRSSMGVAVLDAASCTLCFACTETCPTGALESQHTNGEVAVTFDAALCTGCDQCSLVCPELARGAIRVDHGFDTAALSAGRTTAVSAATALCERCGAPIASTAMLSRIADLLGQDHAASMSYMERRCMDCRGVS